MEKISLYGFGVVFDKDSSRGVLRAGGSTGEKRGCIDSFSSAARLRLRLALLRYFVPSCYRVAVTLTLPWHVPCWSAVMSDFREVIHRFRTYWVRRFPDRSSIFRVELQKRGAPHLHMVSWHCSSDGDLSSSYFILWYDSLLRDLRGGSYSDFARYGVKVDLLPNVIASIRYLCDHSSKSKQAQLGYKGKQWGILGKRNFLSSFGYTVYLGERRLIVLRRWLRRLTRFRVKASVSSVT